MDNYVERNESRDFNNSIRQNQNYIDTSKYWKQISAYREYFPDERILVLFFKDFVANQEQIVRTCYEFLDVEPSVQIQMAMQNQNQSAGKVRPGKLQRFVRGVKPLNRITKELPETLKTPLARILGRKIGARPTWDPEVRQWAIDQLAEDSQQFLKFYGKPPDWW